MSETSFEYCNGVAEARASCLARWAARPPRLWSLLLATVGAGFAVYSSSNPFGMMQPAPFSGAAFWILATAVVVDFVIRVSGTIMQGKFSLRSWRWYAAPILICIVLWARSTSWLLAMRFENSRPALQGVAEHLLNGAP